MPTTKTHDARVASPAPSTPSTPSNQRSHHEQSGASRPPSRGGAGRVSEPTAPPGQEPLLDIRGLAAWLNVSESIVRKWTARGPESGLIPPMLRVNGQVRFRPDDVRTWMQTLEVR